MNLAVHIRNTSTHQMLRSGWRTGVCALAVAACLGGLRAKANPTGMTVAQGSASATQSGSQLTVQAGQNAVLNWQSFNIRPGETTTFVQPSSTSIVWNRVLDPNLSQIWGTLNANGWVVLMNQNGFYFGPNSVINVGGLLVTTSPVAPESSGIGGLWQFNGTPPLASIINYGEIKAQTGGSIFLVSERIENHGTLSAPSGSIGLYAGKEVLISERPDGRGISASVKLPAGSVDNSGNIIADAGTISLHAQVVNQNGLLQANSVREVNGRIELVASEDLHLGENSVVQAKGDSAALSQGGVVNIRSGATFTDAAGSQVDVSGGLQGGDGGSVEISAPNISAFHSRLLGGAQAGWKGASVVLDPTDIILSSDGDGSAGSGTVLAGDNPDTLRLNVNSAFVGFNNIRIEATRDISLDPFTVWNLNDSPGRSDPGSMLTLEAGRNITFGDSSRIVGGMGWSMRLAAGVDFSSVSHSVRNGIGGIYLNGGPPDANDGRPNGSGALETADGSLSLEAGHEILLGSGFIRTVGGGSLVSGISGGNIDIKTGDGDVDAGTNPNWYRFSTSRSGSGYDIDPSGLGGIGTAYGGNVTINSGHDIISFIPTIGAYGAGDVSLTAANRILGKFLVRDGHGNIQAGTDFGSPSSPATLDLVSGGWDLHARDIYLNEVLNPNGVFNNNFVGIIGVGAGRVPFKFDYAPDAYVHLTGDDSVQLLGSNPAHASNNQNADRPPIYPPELVIHAGAGGVVLGNDVVLYPSPKGQLEITTTDGGSLRSAAGNFYQLIMSDSDSTDYRNFATGHAPIPLHLSDPDPVSLVIAGDLQNIFLRSPKRSVITVYGDALNFSFEGQNLSADDGKDNATRKPFDPVPVDAPAANYSGVWIKGDFFSRSDRTFTTLAGTPKDLQDAFFHIFQDPLYIADPDVAARLTYNPVTQTLGFQGRMTQANLNFLLHPLVRGYDQYGRPLFDAEFNPVLVPATFTMDAQALNDLYARSQDIPGSALAYNGLQIGGPGTFSVAVKSMDLGISHGIRSVGPLLNYSLAGLALPANTPLGANLTLDVQGDLTMTSSQIASFNGGNLSVTAGGSMNVGSQEQFTSDDTPKGIYTAHGGNVTVVANGTVDINGSRIATYDGGDVTVQSITDTVNAGAGARGVFTVTTAQKGANGVELRSDQFFGSGIVTFTRRDSQAKVGNILVNAGLDIIAAAGGILQLSFNGADAKHDALLTLCAGRDIRTPSGVLGDIIIEKAPNGKIEGLIISQSTTPPHLDAAPGAGGGPPSINVSGPQVAPPPPPPPPAPPQQATTEEEKKTVAPKKEDEDEEIQKKRTAAAPVLSKTTGRVTVILPNKP